MRATRYAAAFHDWLGEVVDVSESSERNEQAQGAVSYC